MRNSFFKFRKLPFAILILTFALLGFLAPKGDVSAQTVIRFTGYSCSQSADGIGSFSNSGTSLTNGSTGNLIVGWAQPPSSTGNPGSVGRTFLFSSANNINTNVNNPPTGVTNLQANYDCGSSGTYTCGVNGGSPCPLPNATCNLDISCPGSPSGTAASSYVCDGTANKPCVVYSCSSGQCQPTATDSNGNYFPPGSTDTCNPNLAYNQCSTNISLSVNPVSNPAYTFPAGDNTSRIFEFTLSFNDSNRVEMVDLWTGLGSLSPSYYQWFGSNYVPASNKWEGKLNMKNSDGSIAQSKTVYLSINPDINWPPVGNTGFEVQGGILKTPSECVGGVNCFSSKYPILKVTSGGTCTTHNFNPSGSSVSPSTVALGGAYTVTCDYGVQSQNISGPSGYGCTFAGYTNGGNGTGKKYNCTAPSSTTGTFTQYCSLSKVDPENFCASPNNPAGTLTVTTNAGSCTPGATRTAPGVCGGVETCDSSGSWPGTFNYSSSNGTSCTVANSCMANQSCMNGVCQGGTPITTGACSVPNSCTANPNITSVNGNFPVSRVYFSGTSGNLTVTWSAVSGFSSYIVELYDYNGSFPVFMKSITTSGTSATFTNITPNSAGTRYRITVRGDDPNACIGASQIDVTVFPPVTSCPSTAGSLVVSPSTMYPGDTATVYAPSGYICSNYTSSNQNHVTSDGSTSLGTGSSYGTANISATCQYVGGGSSGPSCVVNPAVVEYKANPAVTANYSFNVTPSVSVNAKVGQTAPICASMSVQNTTTGGTGNIVSIKDASYGYYSRVWDEQFTRVYGFGSGSGAYNMLDTDTQAKSSTVCFDSSGLTRGSYTDYLTYAMYDDSGTVVPAPQKTLRMDVNLTDPVYSLNPSNPISFTAKKGDPIPASKTVTVTNNGDTALTVTPSEMIPWAGIDITTQFNLSPNQSKQVVVAPNTTNLDAATYNGTIDFTSQAGVVKIPVQYIITPDTSSCTAPNSRPAPTMSAPSSVAANTSFTISCGYGSDQDNVQVTSSLGGAYNCSWTNWSSTNGPANFACPGVPTAQDVTYTCSTQSVSGFTTWCSLPTSQQQTVTITGGSSGPAPDCGSAAKNYSYSASSFTGQFCNQGSASPSSPTFPSPGNPSSWTCNKTGFSPASCIATQSNPPVNPGNVTVTTSSTCGYVRSTPPGISCGDGGACSYDFPVGTNVVLTAFPYSQCTFDGWNPTPPDDCSSSGKNNCVLTNISSPKRGKANFKLKPFKYEEF
jgi:hypothetical protein